MPAQWLRIKRLKMKKARAKRPRFVSFAQENAEITEVEKHSQMFNYRPRGRTSHEADNLSFIFLKQDRHMMAVEVIDENGKKVTRPISKEALLSGGRIVSDERNAALTMSRASTAVELETTPLRKWFNVFSSYTMLSDLEKGTWLKVFFDRSAYVFVEKFMSKEGTPRIRRSIKYSSKQAAERMLRAGRVAWHPSLEFT